MTAMPRPIESRASGPLAGRLRVPGDKSISHRALILGGLAVGRTRVKGLLEGEDVLRTAAAMRAYGAAVERDGDGTWAIDGAGLGGLAEPPDVLDLGNSGTSARLLLGVAAAHPVTTFMTGDASLRRRPMARAAEPLMRMGARIVAREGCRLPLAVTGAASPLPFEYRLPVPSAQVKSAVLLAGLNAPGETTVIEPAPTRDHTERMLRHFGGLVEVTDRDDGRRITVQGQPELRGADLAVPGDPSSAAFPAVAALIVPGSELLIEGVGVNPLRAGLFETLREMGAAIELRNRRIDGGEPIADLAVAASRLNGVEVPAARAPSMIDEYPILAVAAAFAEGRTVMRGLSELRVKESDRLAATAEMLRVNGVDVEIQGDDLIVNSKGRAQGGGIVATHMDHRLAMSALVMGLASEQAVQADDTAFIATSFPDFTGLMRSLGADLS